MNQNREKCSPEPWPNYDAQSLDIIIEKLLDRGYTWENGLWKALVEQLMFEVVNPLQTEIADLREALYEADGDIGSMVALSDDKTIRDVGNRRRRKITSMLTHVSPHPQNQPPL
jgi:hypothetical protein